MASIAQAFGCRVIFYSASGKSSCTEYERVDFDTLLAQSDVLSLHCPLSDRTRGLIDLSAMKKMKPSAILINVARGPVVKRRICARRCGRNGSRQPDWTCWRRSPWFRTARFWSFRTAHNFSSHRIWPGPAWKPGTRVVTETCKNIEAFLAGEPRNVVS